MIMEIFKKSAFVGFITLLFGCAGNVDSFGPSKDFSDRNKPKNPYGNSIFDIQDNQEPDQTESSNVSANALLWQATIDTVGFMGIKDIDPIKGVIITDWFQADKSDEAFQAIVTISSASLRANSVDVVVAKRFSNNKNAGASEVAARFKDAILMRAREKRSIGKF